MAKQNSRTDSFIAMVLSVNGRVRPVDLSSVPEPDRDEALRRYAETHAAVQALRFDGDTLVVGQATPPSAAPAPSAPSPPSASLPPAPNAPLAPTAAAAETDAAFAELGLASAPPPAQPGEEQAQPGQMLPTPEPASAPVALEEPETPAATFEAPAGSTGSEGVMPEGQLPWTYWLLPVVLTCVGGLIAWFVTRKRAPRQARRLLVTGIVLTFVYGAALFAIFGASIGAYFNSSAFNRNLPPTPAKAVVATSTPAPKTPKGK